MRAVATPPDHDHLFAIAESQDGYFTMAQALEAGFARSTHSYHVKEGNWLREHRGIYRLRQYPQAENGQLVLWSLWSRDRHGEPQGVYSHTTALALRDLSDANPSKLHMTVPPSFRRNSEMPAILVLHKSRLEPQEVIRERGYAITAVMRAILDSATSGDADMSMLEQALAEGLRRGLITRTEIKQAKSAYLRPWRRENCNLSPFCRTTSSHVRYGNGGRYREAGYVTTPHPTGHSRLHGIRCCQPLCVSKRSTHRMSAHLSNSLVLDGYRLVRFLGRGGFGEVWLCRSESMGDYRALKLIPAGDSDRLVPIEHVSECVWHGHPSLKVIHGSGGGASRIKPQVLAALRKHAVRLGAVMEQDGAGWSRME